MKWDKANNVETESRVELGILSIAINNLAYELEGDGALLKQISTELGVTEAEVLAAVDEACITLPIEV